MNGMDHSHTKAPPQVTADELPRVDRYYPNAKRCWDVLCILFRNHTWYHNSAHEDADGQRWTYKRTAPPGRIYEDRS